MLFADRKTDRYVLAVQEPRNRSLFPRREGVQAAIHYDIVKALDDVERARIECGTTRRAFQAHIVKHRC